MNDNLDAETIRENIHNVEDATLKAITDIVAFKMSKSPDDKGPESNFTVAVEMMSEYISKNFSSIDGFYEKLSELGEETEGLQKFGDIVFQYYVNKDHLDFDTVKDRISSRKNIILKTITDLVAYKMSKGPNNKGPDLNFVSAETFVAEYVSMNFKNEEEFRKKISKLGKDMKGLKTFSDIVYYHFLDRRK